MNDQVTDLRLDSIQCDVKEIKESVKALTEDRIQNAVEKQKNHDLNTQHERRITRLEMELEKVIKSVAAMQAPVRVLIWLGGALGLSLLALVWSLITGQASITFSP